MTSLRRETIGYAELQKSEGKIDLGWNFQPLQKKFDSMSVFGG